MIGVVATLKIQDGKSAEFEAVFGELAAKVRAGEPGNLFYQLTKSRAEPNTYKVLELYKDQDALTAHGQSDYFKELGARMGPCMAGRPQVELLDALA
jgi:quinol monooxygenase YgiN